LLVQTSKLFKDEQHTSQEVLLLSSRKGNPKAEKENLAAASSFSSSWLLRSYFKAKENCSTAAASAT
jgi:hypothetical protein